MNTLPKYKLIPEDEYESLVKTVLSLKEQNKKLSKSESQIYNMWRDQYRRAEDLELALKVINDSDLAKQIVELKKELREKIHKREYDIWRLERIIVRKKQRLREYEDAIIRRNKYITELEDALHGNENYIHSLEEQLKFTIE